MNWGEMLRVPGQFAKSKAQAAKKCLFFFSFITITKPELAHKLLHCCTLVVNTTGHFTVSGNSRTSSS